MKTSPQSSALRCSVNCGVLQSPYQLPTHFNEVTVLAAERKSDGNIPHVAPLELLVGELVKLKLPRRGRSQASRNETA